VRFLLDVCVSSRSLQSFLSDAGHDVVSAVSIGPSASDELLLSIAVAEDRVLVTADNDFGELVFVRRLSHGPIVRVVELTVAEQVTAITELIAQHADALVGAVIVTVTRGRVRIRARQ
jgi:predicted nuclease of predicted toxin-antitoxin system